MYIKCILCIKDLNLPSCCSIVQPLLNLYFFKIETWSEVVKVEHLILSPHTKPELQNYAYNNPDILFYINTIRQQEVGIFISM